MASPTSPSFDVTHRIRDTCLCLHMQRAARALARHYDEALRPAGLTNGQFSLLMSLNRGRAPGVGAIAELLGMDRTTVTAALKTLQQRALVIIVADDEDRRNRRVGLTPEGRLLLRSAIPLWKRAQAEASAAMPAPQRLCVALRAIAESAR